MRILDVGGYPGTWTSFAPCAQSITCLNVHAIDWEISRAPQHRISVALGDGRNMHSTNDCDYEIVFSNSVIERVGNWDDQQAFAREVRRVGRNLLRVQTPAKGCPVEQHYLAPFVHWLPKKYKRSLFAGSVSTAWFNGRRQQRLKIWLNLSGCLPRMRCRCFFPTAKFLQSECCFVFPSLTSLFASI